MDCTKAMCNIITFPFLLAGIKTLSWDEYRVYALNLNETHVTCQY